MSDIENFVADIVYAEKVSHARIFTFRSSRVEDRTRIERRWNAEMGFEFEFKLSAVMAVINGVAAGLSYIASQGNITVTIVCTAMSIGITQGISYYKD